MCVTCAGSGRFWSCAGFRCYNFRHPRGDFIEISSSSYNVSLFSSKAGFHHDGGADAAPRESSSVSIGDLGMRSIVLVRRITKVPSQPPHVIN
jgi:hypothetical protein